jgi:hypothetical protein
MSNFLVGQLRWASLISTSRRMSIHDFVSLHQPDFTVRASSTTMMFHSKIVACLLLWSGSAVGEVTPAGVSCVDLTLTGNGAADTTTTGCARAAVPPYHFRRELPAQMEYRGPWSMGNSYPTPQASRRRVLIHQQVQPAP